MDKVTLYLPSELDHALKAVARRKDRPQATIMRDALEAYVQQQDRQQDRHEETPGWPRLIGIGSDTELSSEDIEDWLAVNWHPETDWRRE